MTTELPPGFNPARLVALMRAAIARCDLDLSGAAVLTEAATGAYVVTPVLAAMAGARRVVALARPSRHGSVEEIAALTMGLAGAADVAARIQIVTEKRSAEIAEADIVTNSGHVRPIDAGMIGAMKPSAVIPLMYEAWELRAEDVDLAACRRRGILVAGTNERHPAVDVFSYLGIMATRLLLDAGIAVYGSRVVLCCDNPFAPYVRRGLEQAGASLEVAEELGGVAAAADVDAVLVALRPRARPVVGADEVALIRQRWPGAVVAQYWGDIDRSALSAAGVPYWPLMAPPNGHMGILPAAVGPEPTVRLQAGGLKVGEILFRSRDPLARVDRSYLDELSVSEVKQ